MELGLMELDAGNRDAAKEQLTATLKKYNEYLSENLVQIKVYAALRALGESTDKTEQFEGAENIEDISNLASDDEVVDDDDDE